MEGVYTFFVNESDVGKRLDVFLSEQIEDASRAYLKILISNEKAKINGKTASKSGVALKYSDEVQITFEEPTKISLEPEDIPLNIIYEDDSLLVINKQQGLVVHPSESTPNHTMVNALLHCVTNLSGINGVLRPGIVHRLDKDTSGLILVAKNDLAHRSLAKQIELKQAKRYYIALVDGVVKNDDGEIEQALSRSKSDRRRFVIDKAGKYALTLYKVIKRYFAYSLVEFELKTGRTHQIRVHSKSIGHTVVGDALYGGSNKFHLNGQLLHAYKICFTHPVTNEVMTFTCPIPDYFQAVLDNLDSK